MRTTVQKAYIVTGNQTQRTILKSDGLVYVPREGWALPSGDVVPAYGECYDRWNDVPAAWMGFQAWWK